MQPRHTIVLASLALISACVAPTPDAASETTESLETVDETTALDARPFEVRYHHQPGQAQTYDLSVRQEITYVVSGTDTLGAISADPLPETGRVISRAASQIRYDALETSSESSTTIRISAVFPDVESSASADGEPVDDELFDELTRSLTAINPVEFTVGVNDRNAMLTSSGLGGLNVLNGEVGSLTSLSNNQLSRPLGPVFPETRAVPLRRPWTIESSEEAPGGQEVRVTSTYTAVDHNVIDGANHLSIDGTTQTDGFDLDFSAAFRQIYADLVVDTSGRTLTEAEERALSDVVFSISVQPSSGTSEYLFDVDSGLIVASSQKSNVELVWTLLLPDADSAADTGFEFTMEIDRQAEFSLPRP